MIFDYLALLACLIILLLHMTVGMLLATACLARYIRLANEKSRTTLELQGALVTVPEALIKQ